MKTLHLTRDLLPRATGGLSVAVRWLVDGLHTAGHQAAVVSFDAWRPRAGAGQGAPTPHPRNEGDGPVLRLTHPGQLPAVLAFASAAAPQIIHVHDALLWETAAQLGAKLGARLVFTPHVLHAEQDLLREVEQPTLSRAAEAMALRGANLIAAPSTAVAAGLARHYEMGADKVRLTKLGIRDVPAARLAAAGRRGPIPPGAAPGPLLYAGRFADMHGTAWLWQALIVLLSAHEGLRAVVAGGVPENAKAERKWLRRFEDAAPEAVRARVHFAGWLDQAALCGQLESASLLLAPSLFETFGLSALQAQLYGLPVVGFKAGGLVEVVDSGVTGVLLEVGDVDGLCTASLSLLQDPDRYGAMAAAAARRARGPLSLAACTAGLLDAYADALKG